MTKIESLIDIKNDAVKLLETLMGSDRTAIRMAEEEFQQLVNRFYQENENEMAIQQYELAKADFEYFMRLMDLAIAFYDSAEGDQVSAGRKA